MAYITNYTFSKLCGKLSLKDNVDLQIFKNHIYNDAALFYFFNKHELKYLFNYKQLLESEDHFILNYYNYVPITEDTKTYVFEKPRKLKYHLNNECKFLYQDYVDYHIPDDIRELGNEAVEDFRAWFIAKDYAQKHQQGVLDVSVVVFAYNMVFPARYGVKRLNENYKLVAELENSSVHKVKDAFNYQQFIKALEDIKMRRANTFQCQVTRTLSKFDYLIHKSDTEITKKITQIYSKEFVKNFTLQRLKDLFKASKKINNELIRLLLDYFKWTYSQKKLELKEPTLKTFGLQCCSKCRKTNLL